MQTVSFLGIALFFSWLSLAQAQVSIDPAVKSGWNGYPGAQLAQP